MVEERFAFWVWHLPDSKIAVFVPYFVEPVVLIAPDVAPQEIFDWSSNGLILPSSLASNRAHPTPKYPLNSWPFQPIISVSIEQLFPLPSPPFSLHCY